MGIAVGRATLPHPFDLLKQAEIALHRAKADPVRTVVLFDPEMHAQTIDRATLEHDLRRAIERSELRLHYQPLVDLAHGRRAGHGGPAALGAPDARPRRRRSRSSRWPRRRG